jgi:SAM-dependent methyltransferase
MPSDPHTALPPSAWVTRWAAHIPRGGTVLDVACGGGRHTTWLCAQGFQLVAVDRDLSLFANPPPGVDLLEADIESGLWPFPGRSFDGIVVTNYLHRPLFPILSASLSPGGVLIYETFAAGNERFGKPSNPDFLLKPGELLEVAAGKLRVLGYEDIEVSEPKPAMIQRLCARRP